MGKSDVNRRMSTKRIGHYQRGIRDEIWAPDLFGDQHRRNWSESVQRLATVSLKTASTHGITEFLWWVNQAFFMLPQQTAATAQWLVVLWGL